MRLPRWLGVVLVFGCSPGAAAAAEIESVVVSTQYRTWTLETARAGRERVGQLSYPVHASLRLRPELSLALRTAGAASRYDPSGQGTLGLDGPADVTVELFWRTAKGRLLVTGGLNVPTGNGQLSPDEYAVARVLGHPLGGFRVRQIGTGTNVSGTVTAGGSFRNAVPFAVGVGFIRRGSYELIEGFGDFRPASEISVSAGLDLGRDFDSSNARIDVTGHFFGTDRWAGEKIYEEGSQLTLQTALATARGGYRGSLTTRWVFKGEDTSLSASGSTVGDLKVAPGTGLRLRSTVDRAVRRTLRAGAAFDWNRQSGSDISDENGNLFAVGPVAAFPWVDRSVSVRLLYYFGSMDEGEVDLGGIGFTTSLSWGGASD